jgi:hypothetical protein
MIARGRRPAEEAASQVSREAASSLGGGSTLRLRVPAAKATICREAFANDAVGFVGPIELLHDDALALERLAP